MKIGKFGLLGATGTVSIYDFMLSLYCSVHITADAAQSIRLLLFPLAGEEDPEILKLLHLGHQLVSHSKWPFSY